MDLKFNEFINDEEITSTFFNMQGENLSLTRSLILYSRPNTFLDLISTGKSVNNCTVFPLKRIDSIKIQRVNFWFAFLFSFISIFLWYSIYVETNSCAFLIWNCTTTINYLSAIKEAPELLVLAIIFFLGGFIRFTELQITSISKEIISIGIYSIDDGKKSKQFITELNQASSRLF